MSILAHLRDDAPPAQIERWVQILPELSDLGVPAFKLLLCFMAQGGLNALMKPLQGKAEVSEADEARFRKNFVKATWKDWSGCTPENLTRLAPECYYQIEQITAKLDHDGATVIDFSIEDAMWLGQKMDTIPWQRSMGEAMNLEGFAKNRIEQEKKDSTTT